MADDFDFGFSAVSTDEFKKTQPDTDQLHQLVFHQMNSMS